nr:HD-GYP domain-containing protein [Treponema sp.]
VFTFLFTIIASFDYPNFPTHTWLFKYYYPDMTSGMPYLHKVYSWGHTIFTLLDPIYLFSIIFILFDAKKKQIKYNKNIHILCAMNFIPALCYLSEKIFIKVTGTEAIPVTPIGFAISNIILVEIMNVKKIFDVNRIANNIFFDNIDYPAMVIDADGFVTQINESATRMFPELTQQVIGKRASSVFPYQFNNIFARWKKGENVNGSIIRIDNKLLQLKRRPIAIDKEREGRLLWLEDVTLMLDYQEKLQNQVEEKTDLIIKMRDQFVLGFAELAEHHDTSSSGHLHRTAEYVYILAQELLKEKMYPDIVNKRFVKRIKQVAPLHDIGKSYISKTILDKEGKLTDDEYDIVKSHTIIGVQFIKTNIMEDLDPEYFRMACNVVLHHHERWDGEGYPTGIAGEKIPLEARIMAIADCFDALTTERSYKKAYDFESAYNMIINESGSHFDPVVIEVFKHVKQNFKMIANNLN